jgi:peptide-methionine (R)-S-oxide reductase
MAKGEKAAKSEEEWKHCLTPDQFRVLREKGTEAPGTGALLHNKKDGTYTCAACGAILFSSKTKFDSSTGWPSFYEADKKNVKEKKDTAYGMARIEVMCSKCGGHLGHVFDDGPKPTGMRYCINSAALKFKEEQ